MDFEQSIRRVTVRAMTLITRGTLTGVGGGKFVSASVRWLGKRVSSAVEVLQPQGLFFLPPAGSECGVLSPLGAKSGAFAVCASSRATSPGVTDLAAGEGGLYYAGLYKVFLDADGTVHLGERDATDFVALASLVTARLDAIQQAFDTHTHVTSSACTAGGAAGTAAPTTSLIGPLDPVASEFVKCK
jgi:phage gp45-like